MMSKKSYLLPVLLLIFTAALLMPQEPVGRSVPLNREATRSCTTTPTEGLSLNGIAPGNSIEDLKKNLLSGVEISKMNDGFWVFDSESGAHLKLVLDLQGHKIAKVETDYKGTLMSNGISLISWLDPSEKAEDLPQVSLAKEGKNVVITSSKNSEISAHLTVDSMVRKIVLQKSE